MSLRRVFTRITAALAGSALVLSLALGGSAFLSNSIAQDLSRAVRSIRAAEEVELGLLFVSLNFRLYLDTHDPARADAVWAAKQELRGWLREAQTSVDNEEEQATLDELRASVERLDALLQYGATVDLTTWQQAFDTAFDDAERLIAFNDRQARAAVARARQLRWFSLIFAIVGIALTLAALVFLTIFSRRAIFRPVQRLRAALAARSFDPDARVPEEGPLELREIGADVNELVDRLAAQRAQQLTFLSAVAHDLRNPMTSLRTAAQLATRTDDPEKQRDRARMMLRQVDRMNRLVDDLLDVSRIEAGRFDLKREPQDLREVVRETAQLFEESSPLHELRCDLPDDPVLVDYDPVRVSQVLGNLVSNAIKYSPAGGPVDVRLRTEHGLAIVEVQDRGLGIPYGERESIFEPFRRSGGERGDIPGVGLGLSVARRLVRAHGGTIELESEPGVGSTFRVLLPLA